MNRNRPILTAAQSEAAREELQLSQAKAAREAGINRQMLNGFERGRVNPPDDFLRELREFYESAGFEFEEPESGRGIPAGATLLDPSMRVRDGFLLPRNLPSERVEELLDEFHANNEQIAKAVALELPASGFFTFLSDDDERAQEITQEVCRLMARQYCITAELMGRDVLRLCADKDEARDKQENAKTQGDLVSAELASTEFILFGDEDEEAEEAA